MLHVEADEVRAAAAEVLNMRRRWRADRHVIGRHDFRPKHRRHRRDLQALFIELGNEANRMGCKNPLQSLAEIEHRRQPANACVPRRGAANFRELSETRRRVGGQEAGSSVAIEPPPYARRHRPDDAVVVEGDLVKRGEKTQRRQFPGDPLGEAIVEVRAQELRCPAIAEVPLHERRHRSGPIAGLRQPD
ncbi:MAG: hypothetical protein JWL84_564 [Rhodospirillales bacterium]|nr:hypothetical protein [Rhodospirillales bacterium]